jgi:hypothetical protein
MSPSGARALIPRMAPRVLDGVLSPLAQGRKNAAAIPARMFGPCSEQVPRFALDFSRRARDREIARLIEQPRV